MKNIHIIELMDNRDPIIFPLEASLKDIMTSFVENWRIRQFYMIDGQGILKGVITKHQILEYLAPFYCTLDRDHNSKLNERLDEVKAYTISQKEFPFITVKQYLPEVLCQFISCGQESLPLLDSANHMIGEVMVDSLLKAIPVGSEERLYAL